MRSHLHIVDRVHVAMYHIIYAGGQRAPDCQVQLALSYRDDTPSAPLAAGAWLRASDGASWRLDSLPNGWLVFGTLTGDTVANDTTVVLTPDGGAPPLTPLSLPGTGDCATQLEPPSLESVAALLVPGAAFVPLHVTANSNVPGAEIFVSLGGAAEAQYVGPFVVSSCGDTLVTARASKPGAIASASVAVSLAAAVAMTLPAGDAPAACLAVNKRDATSPATGSSATLALGANGGGRGSDCSVQLVVQFAPLSPPPSGVAAFRIVRTDVAGDTGGATIVVAAGYDTVVSLGAVAGAPSYALYAADAAGGWYPVDAPAAAVTVALTCLGIAAPPSIQLVGDDMVTTTAAYVAAAGATTFITTDGSDPAVAGGSRVWFSGDDAGWSLKLTVSDAEMLDACVAKATCAVSSLAVSPAIIPRVTLWPPIDCSHSRSAVMRHQAARHA